MTLLVGINYTQEGGRTIAYISTFSSDNSTFYVTDYCDIYLKDQFDEVYAIEMDNNHKEFIDYIVTHGCKM